MLTANAGLYLWPPESQLRTRSCSLFRTVHSVLTVLDQGPSSYSSSNNSQPAYTGTAAFGSYQATPAGSGYNGAPSYSYNSPPPQASTSTRPAKQTSPASSKPTAPRIPEQDLDAWLDEKPKAKKAASRKRAAEPKPAANLMSLEPKTPADPLAELLGGPPPAEEDAFAAFSAVPASSPRPAQGDVDPFEAFGATAAAPTNDGASAPAAEGEEADPFAAFLSSTARPASAPPAPAVVSTVEELVAPPSPESDSAVAPAPAPVRAVPKAATAKPKAPRVVKPAAPVSRTAVDKLKDTTSNKRNDEVRSRSLAIMNSALTDRRADSEGPAETAR